MRYGLIVTVYAIYFAYIFVVLDCLAGASIHFSDWGGKNKENVNIFGAL